MICPNIFFSFVVVVVTERRITRRSLPDFLVGRVCGGSVFWGCVTAVKVVIVVAAAVFVVNCVLFFFSYTCFECSGFVCYCFICWNGISSCSIVSVKDVLIKECDCLDHG